MIDVDLVRKDTPGCKTKIHFNNAGASLMPSPVIDAVSGYLAQEAVTGGYETADLRAREIEGFYETMGKLLNCAARNIAFTASATSSFSRALSCIPFEKDDCILIANEDYISNQITFLSLQKRFGVRLVRAKSIAEGGVDLNDLRRLMDLHHPKLVSLSHVPTNSGLIQPVEAVGSLCRERGIPYLVDGCQSAGQLVLDVSKIQCDFLAGTFRKFLRGPRGAGFLFVSDSALSKPIAPLFLDMRGADWIEKDSFKIRADARRFEEWEIPHALLVGSKAAAEYALALGLTEIRKRNQYLSQIVREKLSRLNLIPLDKGQHLANIITVKLPGKVGKDVLKQLRDKNINTSITDRESAVIDFDAKGVSWALRISPHYYNTEAEIELLIEELDHIINS